MCSGLCLAGTFANLGSIHMPRQRSCDCSSKTRPRCTENPWCSVRSLIDGRGLFLGSAAGFSAAQRFRTGQTTQWGRDPQTSAPRSMRAELWMRARRLGRSSFAHCHNDSRPRLVSIGICKLDRRASRRAMFASTIGADRLKANVATAFAVYRPTPGNSRIASNVLGKRPPCFSMTIRAVARRLRARA